LILKPIKVSFKFQFKRLEAGKTPSITFMSAQTKFWNFFDVEKSASFLNFDKMLSFV